jgi:hypothetical protein
MKKKKALMSTIFAALATSSCYNNSDNTTTVSTASYYLTPEANSASVVINSVDVAGGKLVVAETDLVANHANFTRTYASTGIVTAATGWQNSYSASLKAASNIPDHQWRGVKSALFSSPQQACEEGWAQIKETAYTGQLTNATAVFDKGLCAITVDNTVFAQLPIKGQSNSTQLNSTQLNSTQLRSSLFAKSS